MDWNQQTSTETRYSMEARELRIGNLVLTHDPENYYGEEDGWDGIEWKVAEILQFNHEFDVIYVNEGEKELGREYIKVEDEATVIFNPNMIKPIPLTEEWLLRFGFEVLNGSTVWANKKELNYDLSNEHQIFKNEISISDFKFIYLNDNLISKIDYVHSLQNLYFSLTGEELETKKPPEK